MPIPQFFDTRPYQDIQDADMLGIGDLVFDDGSRKFVNGDPEIAATFPPMPEAPDMQSTMPMGAPDMPSVDLQGNLIGKGFRPPGNTRESVNLGGIGDTLKSAGSAVGSAIQDWASPRPGDGSIAGGADPAIQPKPAAEFDFEADSRANGVEPPKFDMESDSKLEYSPELPPDKGISLDGRLVPRGSPDDGLVVVQRTREGGMPDDMQAKQLGDLGVAQDAEMQATIGARDTEAQVVRMAALKRMGEIESEKNANEAAMLKQQADKEAWLKEERDIADTDIKADIFSAKGAVGGLLSIVGAAMMAATGSDAGMRMIESTIDRHVKAQVNTRDTKLNILAKKLNSTEQAIAAGKAKMYEFAVERASTLQELTKADVFEAKSPAVIAALAKEHVKQMQEVQRLGLEKVRTTEEPPKPAAQVAPAQVQKYGEAANAQSMGEKDAQRALRAIGGVYDPKTGRITNRDEILKKGISGVGTFDTFMKELGKVPVVGSLPTAVDTAMTSQEGLDIRAALEPMVTAEARRYQPTGPLATQDIEDARKALGLTSEKGVIDAIERVLNAQPASKAANVSTFGPEAAGVYEQRQRQQGITPSTNASPAPMQMLEPGRAREQLKQQPTSQNASGMPEPYNNAIPPAPKERMAALAGELQTIAGQELPPEGIRILVAQSGHETADGAQMPKGNFFGHKATAKSSGSANLETTEGEGADAKRVKQDFATYESAAESAADHIDLLKRRYPLAWEALQAGDEAAYVAALKDGGYFTGNEAQYLKGIQRRL